MTSEENLLFVNWHNKIFFLEKIKLLSPFTNALVSFLWAKMIGRSENILSHKVQAYFLVLFFSFL